MKPRHRDLKPDKPRCPTCGAPLRDRDTKPAKDPRQMALALPIP